MSSASGHPTSEPAGDGALPGRGLRVLAVTNMWPVGGSFRGVFVEEQVQALRKLGAHVDVEVVAQARGRRDYLLAAPRIRRRVREGNYDIVHVHHGMCALACRFIGDVPRVLGLYGHDINWHWQRWITKLGWGPIPDRLYLTKRMAAAAGEPGGPIIPNGVDFEVFAPGDRDAARARFGYTPQDKVILFGGVPSNWVKGHDVFTDVLAALRERGLPVTELVLPEPGQDRHQTAAKFLAADVLLFTSRKGFEGSPTVVKEATAMNLPVVTTDVGDVAEILSGVHPSAVVEWPEPWGTPEARARLVADLADQVEKVLAVGSRSNGREQNAWLAWDRIGAKIIEYYRDVIARHASRRSSRGPRGVSAP
ncbi:MAG: glycosyltransferase family 4 protein [Micromonosporaceae bacterium]|nr:glycosyltransferase family 4 protein [Micromonosporaceae bacterium]